MCYNKQTQGGESVRNICQNIREKFGSLQRKDPLTDLPDRTALKKINKKRFENGVVSVVFLDLDNFKQINDQLGHQFGDIVLREFADLLKREIRSKDLAIRWGGDEFLICLFDATEKEASKFLNRIKIKTDRLDITRREDFLKLQERFPQKFSCWEDINKELNSLGVSGGISEIEDDLSKAINVADSNMYTDKDNRKDFSEFEIEVINPLLEEEIKDLRVLLKDLTNRKPEKLIKELKEKGFIITKRI